MAKRIRRSRAESERWKQLTLILRDMNFAFNNVRIYPPTHTEVNSVLNRLVDALTPLFEEIEDVGFGFIGRVVALLHFESDFVGAAVLGAAQRADAAGERAAAMLFLIHGQAAIYQVGWSSDAGRDLNAHNLILWQAIQELRQRGVRRLDLGGVNTQRSAGLARFKMGSGGEVITLCGTYM